MESACAQHCLYAAVRGIIVAEHDDEVEDEVPDEEPAADVLPEAIAEVRLEVAVVQGVWHGLRSDCMHAVDFSCSSRSFAKQAARQGSTQKGGMLPGRASSGPCTCAAILAGTHQLGATERKIGSPWTRAILLAQLQCLQDDGVVSGARAQTWTGLGTCQPHARWAPRHARWRGERCHRHVRAPRWLRSG